MALCPAPRPGRAVPRSPPGPTVALWRPPQGPHSGGILPPLHQHPDPFTPRLVFRGPPVTVAPVVPFPWHSQRVNHQLCRPPHVHPGGRFLLAPCLHSSSCPAFQQPALARLHLHLRPSLGEGPPSKCILPGSTPLAYTTPRVFFYNYPLSSLIKPIPSISPSGLAGPDPPPSPRCGEHVVRGSTKGSKTPAESLTRNTRKQVPFTVTLLRWQKTSVGLQVATLSFFRGQSA